MNHWKIIFLLRSLKIIYLTWFIGQLYFYIDEYRTILILTKIIIFSTKIIEK